MSDDPNQPIPGTPDPTIPDPGSVHVVNQTVDAVPPVVPSGEPGLPDPTPGRVRDDSGRFLSKDAPVDGAAPQEPTPPKFAPKLMEAAQQYMTPEEIESMPNANMLLDVVRGRQAQMPRADNAPPARPVAPAPKPEPKPDPEFAIDDFSPSFNEDELPAEQAKSIKEMAEYVNQLKAGVVKELGDLRKENRALKSGAEQSAKTAQTAAQQQQLAFWDTVVSEIPGFVETVGLPSQAMRNPNSPQARAWQQVRPLVLARAAAQNVPNEYVNLQLAAQEAFQMYNGLNQTDRSNFIPGNGQRPGVAVHGTPRMSAPAPGQPRDLTPAEDHEQRAAAMANAWQAAGGNPFGR